MALMGHRAQLFSRHPAVHAGVAAAVPSVSFGRLANSVRLYHPLSFRGSGRRRSWPSLRLFCTKSSPDQPSEVRCQVNCISSRIQFSALLSFPLVVVSAARCRLSLDWMTNIADASCCALNVLSDFVFASARGRTQNPRVRRQL